MDETPKTIHSKKCGHHNLLVVSEKVSCKDCERKLRLSYIKKRFGCKPDEDDDE